MRALLRGQDFLRDPAVVEFLVHRRGEFNRTAHAVAAADAGGARAGGAAVRQVLTQDAMVQPLVTAWSLYRHLHMLQRVYGATALHEVHQAPSADAAAGAAAAAAEAALPFVLGRFGGLAPPTTALRRR